VGAWDDYLGFQTDKAALKKVNILLKDVMRNGYQASYGKVADEQMILIIDSFTPAFKGLERFLLKKQQKIEADS
jgi:hypothetical protein